MRLRELRLFHKMTQQNVADEIGVSLAVYSYYEREEREPSIAVFKKLARLFDVSVDYLIGNDHHPAQLPPLNDYEIELILASRGADERSRSDALLLMKAHHKTNK